MPVKTTVRIIAVTLRFIIVLSLNCVLVSIIIVCFFISERGSDNKRHFEQITYEDFRGISQISRSDRSLLKYYEAVSECTPGLIIQIIYEKSC